jgi:hypothetical protein
MLQDPILMKAVSGLLQRSERQQDLQKLVESFVDVGILTQLDNRNNQIMYGRRGTGKTHILKVLASRLEKDHGNVCIYLDTRTLGSSAQFSDSSLSVRQRCLALFRDIMGEVHNGLLDHIVNYPTSSADAALTQLSTLCDAFLKPVTSYIEQSITSRRAAKDAEQSSAFLRAAIPAKAELSAGSRNDSVREEETTSSWGVEEDDKIIFPALHSLLGEVLQKSGVQIYLLVDEWSSIPIDIQPYLAEFFKKGFLPLPTVVVKIASLEYRSNFGVHSHGGHLGFEVGADISASLDIDDYYVYDRNPERITDAFSDMLYKHLRNELPRDYLAITSGSALASKLFSERWTFQELVRASEGVARDLINIFSTGYFAAHRKGKEKIERAEVLEAARQWFEQDKARNLDEGLRIALQKIVENVIGGKRARSFLLPRELEKHPIIQRLFDLRILHLMQRGYADKDKAGVRYNIYTLDYGTYVDLMKTSKQPEIAFTTVEGSVQEGFIVPFDDKRSIRRIILSQRDLE